MTQGNFTPTRSHNPCVICGDTSGKCRSTETVLLCMNIVDQHSAPPGFKFLGLTSDQLWGKFVLEQGYSESQRLQYQVERATAKKKEQELLFTALPPFGRDKSAKALQRHLGLSTQHRQNLRNRGLTDAQIDAGYFFSVAPGDTLPFGIPSNYPGVKNGKLAVAGTGIACPAWSVDDLIIGWQVRLDDATDNKYRWAKGNSSSHLPNGELPITVCRPKEVQHNWVADIEGILKPYITAQRLGAVCIGASGGNILGSTEQFQAALASLGCSEIRDFPDAGDVCNLNVMRRRIKKYEYYRKLGLEIKVAWWGQVTKEHDDIDELPSLDGIQYISVDEFLALARQHGGIRFDPLPDSATDDFDDSAATATAKREKELEEWQSGYERYQADLQHQSKLQWLADYPQRVEFTQARLNSIDPWITDKRNERFLNLDVNSLQPGVYFIASAMGTGKTTAAKAIVERFDEGNVLSYRNSLLEQFCHDVGEKIEFLWDIDCSDPKLRSSLWKNTAWVAAAVDSCSKLRPKKVIILEEIDKLVDHLLRGATCRRDRRQKLRDFQKHIEKADYVFCFDADLSGACANYISSLAQGKPTYGIKNVYKPHNWEVHMYIGAMNANGDIKTNSKKPFCEDMLADYTYGDEPIIVVSDSQIYLEALESVFQHIHPERIGLRVDSFTKVDNPDVADFLKSPDNWIAKYRPAYLLMSPTVEASLSITIKYFGSVWGFFCGAVNHWSARQMLGRYRVPVPRYVFCKEKRFDDNQGSHSPLPNAIAKNLLKNHLETVREIALVDSLESDNDFELIKKLAEWLDPVSETWNNPHLQALCDYVARDNYSKANLRENLALSLESAGHTVLWESPRAADATEIKLATEHILRQRASFIVKAIDISPATARELATKMESSPEERWQIEKALLLERLPGIELNEEFVFNRHLKDFAWISTQEFRWMLLHPFVQKELDRSRWKKALQNDTPIWDIRCRTLAVRVMRELGLHEIITTSEEWTRNSPLVLNFKAQALAKSQLVKLALNITVKEDSDPCHLLQRFLKKLGVPIRVRQYRIGGGHRERAYSIDHQEMASGDYTQTWSALTRRFTPLLEASQPANIEFSIVAEPVTPHDLEVEQYMDSLLSPYEEQRIQGNAMLLTEALESPESSQEMVDGLLECWDADFYSKVLKRLPDHLRQRLVS